MHRTGSERPVGLPTSGTMLPADGVSLSQAYPALGCQRDQNLLTVHTPKGMNEPCVLGVLGVLCLACLCLVLGDSFGELSPEEIEHFLLLISKVRCQERCDGWQQLLDRNIQ